MNKDRIMQELDEEKVRRVVRDEMARKDFVEKHLDHVWTLFQHLEDTDSDYLSNSVLFFVENYDFDINELPDRLREKIEYALDKEEFEAHVNAEDILQKHLLSAFERIGF